MKKTKTYFLVEFRTTYDDDRKWYPIAGRYQSLSSAKNALSREEDSGTWSDVKFRISKITETWEVVFNPPNRRKAQK